ncbi:MAG: MarR family transcriptional regulator, partial [Lachnospiraceae bacterium]|nr:MarR family transcriptional regulator [Lachnospiraceae bacterium]
GLTSTQYIVFMVLWEVKSATVGEIGKRLFLDEGTLTPLLKKMADKGYVTRERLKEDERVTKVTITKAGEDMKEACKDIPGEVAKCIYSLDEKESLELYGLLYKLLENKKD